MNELATKLISVESKAIITENNFNIFNDDIMKSIKQIVLRYNNKDFQTEILTRLLQFFSVNIPDLDE